ncbi:hypothetical protein [Pararhizobium sp. DWP1-1-3]|uniref:hypothetical protein n=1 Tax=Pararhizobium sp. DWP1-1-3 TaxID=2804652 RepID=UPI003CE82E9F
MLRKTQAVSMLVFGLVAAVASPARAALEAHDDHMPGVAAVAVTDSQQMHGSVCTPPEPQYFSTFIRDMDGTIIGIRYDIVDYVC